MDGRERTHAERATLQLVELEALVMWSVTLARPFTTAQVLAQHSDPRIITHLVDVRAWRKLERGVFVAEAVWLAADARGQHRLTVSGRLLRKGAAWVAARRSSAVFHDLPLLGKDMPSQPQLLRDGDGGRAKGKNRHERVATLPPEERTEIDCVPVACLSRTANDLGRQESFRSALIATDGALRRGLEQEELIALARARVEWPGGWNALKVAQRANGLHETALESLSWGACHTLGIEMPEPQIRVYVGERLVARVDGLWRDHNTIGQADGLFKYKDRQGVIHDKKQDEELEDLGFEVTRWGWAEASGPKGVLDERILRAFARGDRQELDPRVRLVPTTLKDSLTWTGLIAS
ncbi:MAG: hypothetical protein JWO22_2425 [Frankiales bacterium]|nr:hypothetical protein [Frankiales bacterium]